MHLRKRSLQKHAQALFSFPHCFSLIKIYLSLFLSVSGLAEGPSADISSFKNLGVWWQAALALRRRKSASFSIQASGEESWQDFKRSCSSQRLHFQKRKMECVIKQSFIVIAFCQIIILTPNISHYGKIPHLGVLPVLVTVYRQIFKCVINKVQLNVKSHMQECCCCDRIQYEKLCDACIGIQGKTNTALHLYNSSLNKKLKLSNSHFRSNFRSVK